MSDPPFREALKPRRSPLLYEGYGAALAAILIFGWLANSILRGQTLEFDQAVRDAVHSWASPAMTQFMRGLTELGWPPALMILSLLALAGLRRTRRAPAGLLLIVATLGADLLDRLLKVIFHRERPSAFFGVIENGYSFPSGHSITACCFYGVLAAIITARVESRMGKAVIWVAAAVLVVAIGVSRIYLGVHYPSDVVGGYAAGIVWVVALGMTYRRWRPQPT